MPYVLSPMIDVNSPGMWHEGNAYEVENIYSIDKGPPPVNYDKHIIKPHSLTHLETPAHTQKNGSRIKYYYRNHLNYFYGPTLVLKLEGDNYVEQKNTSIKHWLISKDQIQQKIEKMKLKSIPPKILITSENYPVNSEGYHDPNYVLTLSNDAAEYLVHIDGFHLYGTSWKSSDYSPGSLERPIHNKIFTKGIILENLKLENISEGIYFMNAFPLPISNASESPVVPVLFDFEELVSLGSFKI